MKDIADILTCYDTITLEQMDGVKLMNRVDTKYVMTEERLSTFLGMCQGKYRALMVDGSKEVRYASLYYDTDGREMYMRHLYGRKTRQKVRTRMYLSSGLTFLEIKRKDNHGRTRKKRIEIPQGEYKNFASDAKAVEYLERKSWYKAEELHPVLNVTFTRITLVNNEMTERLTIDRGLRFGEETTLDGIVIIEVKQDGLAMTEGREILHELHVHPYRISKYCIGTALTESGLPHNRFNEKIRYIKRLQSSLYANK